MTVRLIATDIDGTILPHLGSPSAFTVQTLARCQQQGVPVVLVTGRPVRWLPDVVDALGFSGTIVCANGAMVVQAPTLDVVAIHRLTADVVMDVFGTLGGLFPEMVLAVETPAGLVASDDHVAGWKYHPHVVLESLADVAAADSVVKVLGRAPGHQPDDLVREASAALAGQVEVTHSSAADCLIEIAAAGVSKASTLADVCNGYGVGAADVVAFGDMPNDVPMLRWAGQSYALADAHSEAVAAATARIGGCSDDAVAHTLVDIVLREGDRKQ